jgi:AraC-like DNA-binding protein
MLIGAHAPRDTVHDDSDAARFHISLLLECVEGKACLIQKDHTAQWPIAHGLLGHCWYYLATMADSLNFLFGQFVPRCVHRVDKYFPYNVLQLMDGGTVELHIDGKAQRLAGRTFWSSYPGPRIRFGPTGEADCWVHRYLAFSGPAVERWRAAGIFPIQPQPVDVLNDYPHRFDEMLELSRRVDRWGAARAALMLESILTELAERRSRPNEMPAWIEPVLAAAHQFENSAVDQSRLATEAGMTPRTFRRQFQSVMGMSASEYVISARINHARELLGMTQLPIKKIAEQLGYKDVSFFTRQFKKVTGVAPAAYRRTREV